MAAIDTRLRIALGRFEAFLGGDITAADRELIHSTSVALQAIAGHVTLPRQHVLQTVRTFVSELEQTRLPNAEIDEARQACAELGAAWGYLLAYGELVPTPSARRKAERSACHAATLAGHLATLIEFHHDDADDQQHADPIEEAFHPSELSSLRLKTRSGRQFVVSVIELPA